MTINYGPADLALIAITIERSQIVLLGISAQPPARLARRFELPDGFEDIDLAILDWIAAEGRRSSRDYPPL
jgi:hypothetical protein